MLIIYPKLFGWGNTTYPPTKHGVYVCTGWLENAPRSSNAYIVEKYAY